MECALDAGETKMPLSQSLPSVNSGSSGGVSAVRDYGTIWQVWGWSYAQGIWGTQGKA